MSRRVIYAVAWVIPLTVFLATYGVDRTIDGRALMALWVISLCLVTLSMWKARR